MEVLFIILVTLAVVCFLCLLYFVYWYLKNDNTYNQRVKIIRAIDDYQRAMRKKGKFKVEVVQGDKEDYDDTMKRWWDWGYKRILPPDKYSIIKPYIKR